MAFKAYLVEQFPTTHENRYFRSLVVLLQEKFGERQGEHVLIGNISCNGHQIDAVFIAYGQITVIDFKDYGGNLVYSENNPWRITTPDNKLLFVAGGARCRNPFQQVKAYRFSLMDMLSANEEKIVHGVRSVGINWSHVSCVVLFHQDVHFDKSAIPARISRFFHISDTTRIQHLLSDLISQELELDDHEIQAILEVLDVWEENLFVDNTDPAEDAIELKVENKKNNLAVIKKVARNNVGADQNTKIISFYETMIGVERYREETVETPYSTPFDSDMPYNDYTVNFTIPDSLHAEFIQNQQERYPKNLVVGLDLSIDGRPVTVMNYIIDAVDIDSNGIHKVDLDDFELHTRALEQAGLTEDIIDELTSQLAHAEGWRERLQCIGDCLGIPTNEKPVISLGMSQESLYSAQLLSELKKIKKEGNAPSLLQSYLTKEPFISEHPPLQLEPFIQLTPLNLSQKKAIESAFHNPLSVVTGPPGTGKSQVVVNIVANAIVSGHSVLFASKNNKAVDTVKERFDEISKMTYLLRLGSKDQIRHSAVPEIRKQINRCATGNTSDVARALNSEKQEIVSIQNKIALHREQIDLIPTTSAKLEGMQQRLVDKENEYSEWRNSLNPDHQRLFLDMGLIVNVDANEARRIIHKINRWNSGKLSRFLFRLLKETELEKMLREINSRLQQDVEEYLAEYAPWASTKENLLVSGKRHLKHVLELSRNGHSISATEGKWKDELRSLRLEIEATEEVLRNLEVSKEAHENSIRDLTNDLINKSSKALELAISQRLFGLDVVSTQRFIQYLPIQNIWRDEDLASLDEACERFLENFSAVCLTNLSVKNSLPLKQSLVDLLVIDEASQCDIASAIPLIARAKRVAVIGDPLQLRHITIVKDYEQEYLLDELELSSLQLNYVEHSLYDHCFELANYFGIESVFLEEHYRCHPKIAEFSNSYFYTRRLGQTMLIRSCEDQFRFGDPGLNWLNVRGAVHGSRNINKAEIQKCISLASKLAKDFPDASIGIVTPFRDQYKALFRKLDDTLKSRIKADTVHKYQGDEKDIIIFSLVVAENCPPRKARFLSNNEYLINVAITRARSCLYVVGDFDYCKSLHNGASPSPLSQLARYAETLGTVYDT